MDWTLESLTAMGVPEDAAQTLLAAHAEALEAMTAQAGAAEEAQARCEALTAQLTQAQTERDELSARLAEREQADAEAAAARRTQALRDALIARQANEHALPLLLAAAQDTQDDPEAAAGQLAQTYPALFARTVRIPLPTLTPPVDRHAQAITEREIRAMTADEINRNWSAVKAALTKGERH